MNIGYSPRRDTMDQKNMVVTASWWYKPGLEITLANSQNASDFDNLRVRKYPLANVCELESSMFPKQRERIC